MDVEESCTETSTFPNRNLPYSYGKFIALFAIFSAVSLMLTTITLENFPSATLFKQTQTSDAVNGMKAQENDKYDVIYAASSPTVSPITKKPTRDPTTQKPTEDPTSKRPTENPTHKPTQKPTATPSEESTSSPTYSSDTPPGELFNLTYVFCQLSSFIFDIFLDMILVFILSEPGSYRCLSTPLAGFLDYRTVHFH